MLKRVSKAIEQKSQKVNLSKKWTVGGIIIALSGLFLNPDACLSGRDLIHFISPDSGVDTISHVGILVGSIFAILGKGLLERD